jgi:hypothetical protein
MMKVRLLCGREHGFPPAFLARVNELGKKEGVTAEFAKLGGTRMQETSGGSIKWSSKKEDLSCGHKIPRRAMTCSRNTSILETLTTY